MKTCSFSYSCPTFIIQPRFPWECRQNPWKSLILHTHPTAPWLDHREGLCSRDDVYVYSNQSASTEGWQGTGQGHQTSFTGALPRNLSLGESTLGCLLHALKCNCPQTHEHSQQLAPSTATLLRIMSHCFTSTKHPAGYLVTLGMLIAEIARRKTWSAPSKSSEPWVVDVAQPWNVS